MLHRHLTLERYELTLESDPQAAARLREHAASCPACRSALSERPLAGVLNAWPVPLALEQAVDWEPALKRAISPSRAPVPAARRGWLRPVLVFASLAVLLVGGILPANASAPPASPLFPVRGWTEQAAVGLTPDTARGKLEAQYAATYIIDAQASADHHDSAAYRASMDRFFYWAGRLRTDVKLVPQSDRSAIRANLTAAKALLPSLVTSSPDQGDVSRADELLTNVQVQSQENNGDQQGN